jgi:hypothetical protein
MGWATVWPIIQVNRKGELEMPIDRAALAQSSYGTENVARLMAMPDEVRFAALHTGAKMRMEFVDQLPAEWRALVHEFGLTRIRKLRANGVSYRSAMAELYATTLDL